MNRAQLLACPECDLLQSDPAVSHLQKVARRVLCARCGATLYQRQAHGVDFTLALTVTALALFGMGLSFPIVSLELQGERTDATLMGAVYTLSAHGRPILAGLVFFTVFAMPLARLAALGWLLIPLRFGRRAPAAGTALRLARFGRQWGMVDVFFLGVLVALVKLGHLANVHTGVALWSFAGLMVVMAAIEANFGSRDLWSRPAA
jgi:paraquat-inducible protein A